MAQQGRGKQTVNQVSNNQHYNLNHDRNGHPVVLSANNRRSTQGIRNEYAYRAKSQEQFFVEQKALEEEGMPRRVTQLEFDMQGNNIHNIEFEADAFAQSSNYDAGPSLIDDEILKIDEMLGEDGTPPHTSRVTVNVSTHTIQEEKSPSKEEFLEKFEQMEVQEELKGPENDKGEVAQSQILECIEVPPEDIEKEKIEHICEDIGLDSKEFFKERSDVSNIVLVPSFITGASSVPDVEQIQETFFEDPTEIRMETVDTIKGMEEYTPEPQADESLQNLKSIKDRSSEATALKFMIDLSEPVVVPSYKEKKERKSKSAKRRLTIRLPLTDDIVSRRISDLSTYSRISKTVAEKPLMIQIEPESTEAFEDRVRRGQRKSMMSRRTSFGPSEITYSFEGRMGNIEEGMEGWYNYDLSMEDSSKQIMLPLQEIAENVEEESVSVKSEEEDILDRKPFYERYQIAIKFQKEQRIKNNFLQKYTAMLFRRRKVTNFLLDHEPSLEHVIKYFQRLKAYGETKIIDSEKRTLVNYETNLLKETRNQKCSNFIKMFDQLQRREETIGAGLIHTKTGKPISEKLMERYIKRQKATMDILCRMRLEYIKIRNMLNEKVQALNKIGQVSPDRRLIEYEQLKVENRGLADRIEEKDEDLVRVRSKCQATIQVLAHLREKSAALEADIYEMKGDLETTNIIAYNNREAVNSLRKQKTETRAKITKLKQESGLLTEPVLLGDMDNSKLEAYNLEQKFKELQEDVVLRTKEIKNIRLRIQNKKRAFIRKTSSIFGSSKTVSHDVMSMNIEKYSLKQKSKTSLASRTSTKKIINKPRLVIKPTVIQNDKVAFDDLVRIKPVPTFFIKNRSALFD